MLIIVAYFTYRYVQSIIDKGYYNDLVNKFFKVGFCVNVYGIYEFFAPKYNLPLFLNIFNNNPSFGKPKGIYSYYGGWVDLPRIYTLFFEPSVYSTFLVLLLMFLILDKDIRNKKVYFCFAFINLILTFARTGWGIFIYCIGVYIIFKILKKLGLSEALYSFISVFVLMIPFFNLLLMYIANIYIFNDLSSLGRTNSAVYYLAKTFDNAKTFLFGHGLGHISFSWTKDLWYEKGVEGFAHNGYIEFLYELGVILFLVTLSYIFICVKRIKNYRNRTILLGIIGSVSSFSSTYQIESILALIIVIFCYSIHHEKIQYKN
jgi:O-antigen ligase